MMPDRKMKAAKAAFDTSIDCGITLFDTAEVYGSRVRMTLIYAVSFLRLCNEKAFYQNKHLFC